MRHKRVITKRLPVSPWIGVDLDGTLAEYHGWMDSVTIGKPIAPMLARVKKWLKDGIEVRIFTARACDPNPAALPAIEAWCKKHVGTVLAITNIKDYGMIQLWDDRAVQVIENTGGTVSELYADTRFDKPMPLPTQLSHKKALDGTRA